VALIAVILVNIWLGTPFNLTLLYSGLQDIPTSSTRRVRWTKRLE
jgi:ABC-type sugar transport system permease subunit